MGYVDSWTCPTYILSRELIGQHGGDEDPLPPNGGSPHPLPHIHNRLWHDEVLGNIPVEQMVQGEHNANLGGPYEDVHPGDQNNMNVAGNDSHAANYISPAAVVDNSADVAVMNNSANVNAPDFIVVPMEENTASADEQVPVANVYYA